jgi:predicted AAA+ superfamily ATPase
LSDYRTSEPKTGGPITPLNRPKISDYFSDRRKNGRGRVLTFFSSVAKMVDMKETRYLMNDIQELCFNANKMAFISGPRQAGKTTLAKWMLKQRGNSGHYYNWDETKFRRLWAKDPANVIPEEEQAKKSLIVLDEIHKAKLWKRSIKGIYDTLENPCDILVTGSAKLNVYRKGSDSLMGRYYHLRLHPFSLAELIGKSRAIDPDQLLNNIFSNTLKSNARTTELLENLIKFGPFPDPLFSQSVRKLNLWRRSRIEKLVREDLRDLSRLPELSQVEMLVSLLPERVGSPLSINSLREDLEVAHTTVQRWLSYLNELYYHFEVKPYHKSFPRAIKKEGKLYLWDWSEVADPGARFENLIASHLLKYCHYLTDTGFGEFKLHYLRNKEKEEIDFLIVKDKKPWLPIEVKLNDENPSPNWLPFMKHMKCTRALQVTLKNNVFKIVKNDGFDLLVISADKFLQYLI